MTSKLLKIVLSLSLFTSLFFGWSHPVWAVRDGIPVHDIIVRGSQNISPDLVLSQIRLKKGDPFESAVLNEDLRRLYSLGYFSDITVQLDELDEGVDIIFSVTEKLTVTAIIISGNDRFRTKKLVREITLLEGSVLNQSIVQSDVNQLKAYYEKKGHSSVIVQAEIDADPETQSAVVTYVIVEGPRVKIRSIIFEGNDDIPDKVFVKAMRTKKSGIFQSGYMKREIFQADLDAVMRHYRDQGYINARILKVDETESEDKKFLDIVIVVEEGDIYQIGEVRVNGNILFPEEDLRKYIAVKRGNVYNLTTVSESIGNVEGFYGDRGYIYAKVDLFTKIDEEKHNIDLEFRVSENEKIYIENIIIRGNAKTKDIVIRRNITLKPLDAFDGGELSKSQERLLKMEYFEDVRFNIEPGSMPNHENLIVDVVEKKTGNLSFGAGYSTIENLIGFVEMTQTNFDIGNFPSFIGGGQRLRLRAEIGRRRRDYELNFVEPWLFDYPVLFGLDLFNRDFFRDDFDERRTGGAVRLGKALGEHNYISARYKIENVKIDDFSIDASPLILAEGGTLLSSLTVTLSRNTTNSGTFPTRGYSTSFSTEFMGGPLGGDVEYLKYNVAAKKYYSFIEKQVLELSLDLGTIQNYGASDRVPIFERFFAGGNNLRGFGFRQVGPRDAANNPIGGNTILLASAEYSFPVYKDVIRGAVFYDTGNVYEDEFAWNLGSLVSGAGVGVRVKTPFGPMKLDYAWVLDKDERDPDADSARWHFGVGKLF
ncbi:outer membrane protein assembly factor BamA [PVC group bacterium]|nr:outer membrane protein assembly factor BamA [PVC group bacterium]